MNEREKLAGKKKNSGEETQPEKREKGKLRNILNGRQEGNKTRKEDGEKGALKTMDGEKKKTQQRGPCSLDDSRRKEESGKERTIGK